MKQRSEILIQLEERNLQIWYSKKLEYAVKTFFVLSVAVGIGEYLVRKIVLVCEPLSDKLIKLSFDWQEISQTIFSATYERINQIIEKLFHNYSMFRIEVSYEFWN